MMKEKIALSSKIQPKPKKKTPVYTLDASQLSLPTPKRSRSSNLSPMVPSLNSQLLSAATAEQASEWTPRKRQISELYGLVRATNLELKRLSATVSSLERAIPVLLMLTVECC